jgi:hypothetical protein
MAELFATGRIVDLILLLMVLEAGVLIVWTRSTDLLGNLLAGVGLLLALRGALAGIWWGWIALCLGAALLAHLADLRHRCRATRTPRWR